jgi:hypothetical protein
MVIFHAQSFFASALITNGLSRQPVACSSRPAALLFYVAEGNLRPTYSPGMTTLILRNKARRMRLII